MPQREEGAMMPIEKDGGLEERVRELQSFQVFAMRAVDVGCVRMIAEKLTGRPQTLNPKPRALNTGHSTLDTGHSTLDTQHWTLDTRH
jgi:hypothetical protein